MSVSYKRWICHYIFSHVLPEKSRSQVGYNHGDYMFDLQKTDAKRKVHCLTLQGSFSFLERLPPSMVTISMWPAIHYIG
jgi:hypothetical protein